MLVSLADKVVPASTPVRLPTSCSGETSVSRDLQSRQGSTVSARAMDYLTVRTDSCWNCMEQEAHFLESQTAGLQLKNCQQRQLHFMTEKPH